MTATGQLVMEGGLSGRPTEYRFCRYVALKGRSYGNHFWLSMGYKFSCVIASGTIFDSRGEFSRQAIWWIDGLFRGSKERCHGNHVLAFCIWGAHWRYLVNTTESSVYGGDAALCQISLTTCYYYYKILIFAVLKRWLLQLRETDSNFLYDKIYRMHWDRMAVIFVLFLHVSAFVTVTNKSKMSLWRFPHIYILLPECKYFGFGSHIDISGC